MSTLVYSAANDIRIARPGLLQVYAGNLAYAARLLWGALLARSPKQVERQLTRRQKLRALQELNQMAHDVETSMPSLAAELRQLANRG